MLGPGVRRDDSSGFLIVQLLRMWSFEKPITDTLRCRPLAPMQTLRAEGAVIPPKARPSEENRTRLHPGESRDDSSGFFSLSGHVSARAESWWIYAAGIIHMTKSYSIKTFLMALLPIFALLAIGQLARNRGLDAALLHAAVWAPITAAVYLVAMRYRRCKGCVHATQRPSA